MESSQARLPGRTNIVQRPEYEAGALVVSSVDDAPNRARGNDANGRFHLDHGRAPAVCQALPLLDEAVVTDLGRTSAASAGSRPSCTRRWIGAVAPKAKERSDAEWRERSGCSLEGEHLGAALLLLPISRTIRQAPAHRGRFVVGYTVPHHLYVIRRCARS